MNNSNKKRWFKKWWGILLIILCPYLLFLVILQSNLDKKKKIIFSTLFGNFILFIFLITALEPNTEEKIAKEKQKQEKLKKLEHEKTATLEQEAKINELENQKRKMNLEKEAKLKAETEKQIDNEIKQSSSEILLIVSNDDKLFRQDFKLMTNYLADNYSYDSILEAKKIALNNINKSQYSIEKLKNIKCNLACNNLNEVKTVFIKLYILRIDMLKELIKFTDASYGIEDITTIPEEKIFRRKVIEYTEYQNKIISFFENIKAEREIHE